MNYLLKILTVTLLGFLSIAQESIQPQKAVEKSVNTSFSKDAYNSKDSMEHQELNSKWMSLLDDQDKPGTISVPGTHDSMAYQLDSSGLGGLQITKDKTLTQSLNITQQLKMGIRYFDIRAKVKDGKLGMYHGSIWLKSYFDDFLDQVQDFINENPGEFIYMRFKSEGDDTINDFEGTLKSSYLENPKYKNMFYLEKTSNATKVGDFRGKIIFIQNFNSINVNVGGYVYPWQFIQDDYEVGASVEDLYKKSTKVINHLESDFDSEIKLSLNHLSGSNSGVFSKVYPWYVASGYTGKSTEIFKDAGTDDSEIYPLWPIEDGKVKAAGTNIVFLEYLKKNHKKHTGVIIMDFPGQELVDRIIHNNVFKSEKKGSLEIKYLAEEAIDIPIDSVKYIKHSQGKISDLTPIRVGYKFKGWSYEGEDYAYLKNKVIFMPNDTIYMYKDALLVGLWEQDFNHFTLNYISEGDVENMPQKQDSFKYNELLQVSDMIPKRKGYRFLHWTHDNTIIEPGSTFRITKNINLVPVWKKNEDNTISVEEEAKTSLGLWIYVGE